MAVYMSDQPFKDVSNDRLVTALVDSDVLHYNFTWLCICLTSLSKMSQRKSDQDKEQKPNIIIMLESTFTMFDTYTWQ